MAKRSIKTKTDEFLYKKSDSVSEFNQELRDMFDTMYDYNGVGFAVVQAGVLKRVMVIDLEQSGL